VLLRKEARTKVLDALAIVTAERPKPREKGPEGER
jgi:hypothetical protein